MTVARSSIRAIVASAIVAALLASFGAAFAHHGPAHPPKKKRGADPEAVDSIAPAPQAQKFPKEKVPVVKPAPKVLGTAAAATAASAALSGLEPSNGAGRLAPLSAQVTDEIIARDLANMDALEAKLASLPGAESDPWRATAARSWIVAARHEYEDNDPTGFPQAAFERAAGLVHEIEAGEPAHTVETMPPSVPPRGSSRVADSLYVELEALKRHQGLACIGASLAEAEVALAWAGNEQAGPGGCVSSPHLDRARVALAEARRQAESCTPP
jgi:hypothetical protein